MLHTRVPCIFRVSKTRNCLAFSRFSKPHTPLTCLAFSATACCTCLAFSALMPSRAGPPERMRPNSAPWPSAAFLSRCCLQCRRHPVCLLAPDSNRTACTGRGRRGAVSLPPALDLVPRERCACDSVQYFRACTERRSGPRLAEAGRLRSKTR